MTKFFSFCRPNINSRLHIAIIMLMLILIGVFHFWFYNHQKDLLNAELVNLDKEIRDNRWMDIESIIKLTKVAARNSAKETADRIVADIHQAYPDLAVLENELTKVGYGSPDFVSIIHKNISGKYLYNIRNKNNDIFVISKHGIVLDLDVDRLGKATRSFTDEAGLHYNGTLMYTALDSLLSHKENTLVFYEPESPDVENHILITSPSRDSLKEVYMTEGLNGLKGYNILVPAYITDDGDVFGVPDVAPDGSKNRNHKIIVVQSFSIYDIMQKLITYSEYKDKSFMYARKGIAESMDFSSMAYLAAMILDFIAILSLLFYATEKSARDDDLHDNT